MGDHEAKPHTRRNGSFHCKNRSRLGDNTTHNGRLGLLCACRRRTLRVVDPEWNQSWTHHEYQYALLRRIPILVFIREPSSIPPDKSESNPEQRLRLDAFLAEIRGNHLCKMWTSKHQLMHEVGTALSARIDDDMRSRNKPLGWRRAVAPRVTPSISSMRNWVIASQLSPFTDALRKALDKERDRLGIVYSPEFRLTAKQHFFEYRRLLSRFMEEAPNGSWLFTNYPEDNHNPHSPDDEDRLIQELLRKNKRLICFESGHNLRARGNFPSEFNPVGVIDTNAPYAIQWLIRHMTSCIWRKHGIKQIEIVSIMGPCAFNTQERAMKYSTFLLVCSTA